MDKRILDVIERVKDAKGFPPKEIAQRIKTNHASRGLGESGPVALQVSNIYNKSIVGVADGVADVILDNISKFDPSIVVNPELTLVEAGEYIFNEGLKCLLDEFSLPHHKKNAENELEQHRGSLIEKMKRRARTSDLNMATSSLRMDIPSSPSAAPIAREERGFQFIRNNELRKILTRDYREIQQAFASSCWKAVIILSGGSIEAILLDLLQRDQDVLKNSEKKPREPDLTRWDLSDLISVCVELGLVEPGLEKLSHSVREYRNLIHPGNEIRNKLTFGKEEARIAFEVLNMVDRDLSNSGRF